MGRSSKFIWRGLLAGLVFFSLSLEQAISGSLEPSGSPGPTMKTLDEIPPSWSRKLPGAQRFVVVLDGQAVLDKETGLVWQKTTTLQGVTLLDAYHSCSRLQVGGRFGWRLPTIDELSSLVDTSVSGSPKLPAGHPFSLSGGTYWSLTFDYDLSQETPGILGVNFTTGEIPLLATTGNSNAWCVRGK